MGGTIGVKSVPGKGSTFFFHLDLPYNTALESEESETILPASTNHEDRQFNVNILLIEDTPMNQRVAAGILRRYGCMVDIAENGEKGVKRFKEKSYDLIFMDAHMPVMDGFEATRAIREYETGLRVTGCGLRVENEELNPVPRDSQSVPRNLQPVTRTTIIAMTALAMEGDRERCIEAGMDDYISKPIRSRAILDVLIKYCSKQTAQKHAGDEQEKINLNDPVGDDEMQVLNPEQLVDISDHDEELILELIDEFLKDAPVYLNELQDAIASGDQDQIEKKAHRLNGLVANCGGVRLLEIGQEIEHNARRMKFHFQSNALDLFKIELDYLMNALRQTDWKLLCE